MEYGVLDKIGFRPNIAFLAKHLHLKPESRTYSEFLRIVKEAVAAAKPKAAWRVGYIEENDQSSALINGIRFTSKVLCINLEPVHRVFFYLATCGEEMEAWSKGMPDMLYQFWADTLREAALKSASRALNDHLKTQYQLPKTSAMAPGSLEDWPITQQRQLFEAMDGLDQQIGVKLTDSYLMLPIKSISGIRFPSEDHFESCMLCPRENCPGRRAAYNAELYKSKFA